jgi:cytochrome oxidase assembly protein ShyY1
LHRADEKRLLQKQFEEHLASPPVAFNQISKRMDDIAFKTVQLTGVVDNDHTFLLDNSIRDGKVGYEVLSPFKTNEGQWVIINRGWVIGSPLRSQLPNIPALSKSITVDGYIYVPSKTKTIDESTMIQSWPQVIEVVDTTFIGKRLHLEVFPYTIRVLHGGDIQLKQEWTVTTMSASKHTAYAAQWFLMAVVLIGLFIYSSWPSKGEHINE